MTEEPHGDMRLFVFGRWYDAALILLSIQEPP